MNKYDSTADTLQHIKLVNTFLIRASQELLNRAVTHDKTKLESPEKELFDEYTPILKELKYGSDEYKASLEKLKPALDHHYSNNPHHPEFYKNGLEGHNGINGMTLFDILEMYMDWLAATERTKDGDIKRSIEINKERFGMSDQLVKIFMNTVERW